jgi:cobalt-precorrin-5B (C1)-methyltransferase
MARSGYTLPVFAAAAAKAALLHLQQSTPTPSNYVSLDLLPDMAEIPIQQMAKLGDDRALAITLSDPGDNLDLTRNTPIWAEVTLGQRQSEPLILLGGEGLGKNTAGDPAIYSYAKRLFEANLIPLIPPSQTATVTIVLPEGRQLAQRTSNAAFGIVDGLSLLGTSGISKPLSAEDHLQELRQALRLKAKAASNLVFCIGSNGIQVADRLGIPDRSIVQTGNWIGAMLVEAGLCGVRSVLLLGYQGKLVKLAGGIFNTSSHLADAKREIISAAAIRQGQSIAVAQTILNAKTADAAYKALVEMGCVESIFQNLAQLINQNAQTYVQKYANVELAVTTVLFDRQGQIIVSTGEVDLWRS